MICVAIFIHFLCGFFWSTKTTQPPFFVQKGSEKYHFEAFPNDHSGDLLFRTILQEDDFQLPSEGGSWVFSGWRFGIYCSSTGAGVDHLSIHPRIVEWLAPDGFFSSQPETSNYYRNAC